MLSSKVVEHNYQRYALNYADRKPSNESRLDQGDFNGGVNKSLAETRRTNAIVESRLLLQALIPQN